MLTVAYLGPEHTNAHVAALKKFGRRARYAHAPTVEDIFSQVERRQADYGVVPIENSLEGAVTHTLDRFIDFVDTPVRIHGEVEQPIRHFLITRGPAALRRIRAVYSHPQALAQCHRWLLQQLPHAQRRETSSTADAITYVLEDHDTASRAAIARAELAAKHRLHAQPIPEQRENKTRFLIIGLGEPRRGRKHKTSILFVVKDKPGALHDALLAFKRNRINLTKIESRPSKRKAWEYLFFVDAEGHTGDPGMRRALETLKRSTSLLRVLGSYPVAK